MTRVAMLLWFGEMRVQRLISRSRAIAVGQLCFVTAILAFLAVRVESLVAGGGIAFTNISVLTLVGSFLIFANVIVTGEQSLARVQDIRQWAQTLPVSSRQLRGLLVTMGLLRGALFTATLIGTTAVGAFLARHAWDARVEVVLAALVLPLLPVAIGLWFGARRTRPVPNGFVTLPIAIAMFAIAIPFPNPHGVALYLLRIVAAPGLTLIGAAPPVLAAAVLIPWLAGTALLLSRLDRNIEVSLADGRPWSASSLATGPVGRRISIDVVVHRLQVRDLLENVLMALLLGGVAVLGQVQVAADPRESAASALAVVALALPVTMAGHRQVRTLTLLDDATEGWLASLPLPTGAVAWSRHVVGVAWATVAAGVFLAVLTLGRGGPSTSGFVVIALTPVALTGWLALALRTRGVGRFYAIFGVSQLVGIRLVIAAVLAVTGTPMVIGFVLAGADLGFGGVGHLALRNRMRST